MKKTLKKNVFAAKVKYYGQQMEFYKSNSKKVWRLINEITGRQKRGKKKHCKY